MIASALTLSRQDCQALHLVDAYSVHRVVYDLFPDIRSEVEKETSVPSGILFVDKGGDFSSRNILILSNRPPREPERGTLNHKEVPEHFLAHQHYGFEVRVNPSKRDRASGKTLSIGSSKEALVAWFLDPEKEASRGFQVDPESLQVNNVGVQRFEKVPGKAVLHATATFKGKLKVIDQQLFIQSFQNGLGRAKAFGFGLLQIIPLQNHSFSK